MAERMRLSRACCSVCPAHLQLCCSCCSGHARLPPSCSRSERCSEHTPPGWMSAQCPRRSLAERIGCVAHVWIRRGSLNSYSCQLACMHARTGARLIGLTGQKKRRFLSVAGTVKNNNQHRIHASLISFVSAGAFGRPTTRVDIPPSTAPCSAFSVTNRFAALFVRGASQCFNT